MYPRYSKVTLSDSFTALSVKGLQYTEYRAPKLLAGRPNWVPPPRKRACLATLAL
jgi:hypothetical protein